ncbi:MAG: cytochrome b N-terminal domain-containing protein [Acidobacteria bacterium]|nr:cytochrome b N-terminal domain-containing protein [Acidobacteriota bacterium]
MGDRNSERPLLASARDAIASFLLKPVPEGVGWPHVLGSGILFLLVLQAITGVLLAINYDPTPGRAYASVRYITETVAFGHIIRGLHHWAASLLIVVLLLHLGRVFIYGAYKRPRQATWVVGVCLFVTLLAFGFTGYLLPWDQKAYWATVVGTKIAGSVPVVGDALLRLIRGGDMVGAPTLTRFYVLHLVILPALVVPLVLVHLWLVRRHGIAPPWEEVRPVTRWLPFHPFQLVRDVAFSGLLLAILFALTLKVGVPLEAVADSSATDYIPRPEWYFLPLFQLLKLPVFYGRLEFVGGVLLPAATILLLLALPFYDRNPSCLPARRRFALAAGGVFFTAAIGLGVQAWIETPAPPATARTRGEQLFEGLRCQSCHAGPGEEQKSGPSLASGPSEREREWLAAFLVNPAGFFPGSEMPATGLTGEDLDALVNHVANLRADYGTRVQGFPSARACATCHRRQFEEWKTSYHARSLGTTFRAMFVIFNYNTGGQRLEYCLNCHAPDVKVKDNAPQLSRQLLAGESVTSEGIGCAACHALRDAEEHPDPALQSVSFDPGPLERHLKEQTKPLRPFFKEARMCGACHDYNATYATSYATGRSSSAAGPPCCTVVRTWEQTAFARRGVTCQSCHMKSEMGVTTREDEPAYHGFPGPRNEAFLRKGVDLAVTGFRQGSQVEATVAMVNKTGHPIPDG